MDQFDKFDSPHYSNEKIDLGNEGIGGKIGDAASGLKKYLKIIVILAILGIVGYFAYDFFIGSMREITILINNTENQPVSGNFVLFDSTSNPVQIQGTGDGYNAKLRVGSYKYELSASGYKTKTGTIEVSKNGTETIVIEKDFKTELVDFDKVFPEELIEGQTATMEFQIRNIGANAETVEIVFEEDITGWISNQTISIGAKDTKPIIVTINVPNTLKVTDAQGKKMNATARIKYTKKSQTREFKVFPAPSIEMKITGLTTSGDAGETITGAKAEIENKSKFSVKDLELRIEITSAPVNEPVRVIKWFKFQDIAGSQEPWKMDIDEIKTKERIPKGIRIDVPLTAKTDTITGKVILSASFLPIPIQKEFNLEIKKEATHGITLNAKESIDIEWDEEKSDFEEKTETLTVKNTGSLDLSNVVVTVKNSTSLINGYVCDDGWLTLLEPTTINEIKAGKSQEILMKITTPKGVRGEEATMYCKVKYRYDNPLKVAPGDDDYVNGEMPGFIQIEPQAD